MPLLGCWGEVYGTEVDADSKWLRTFILIQNGTLIAAIYFWIVKKKLSVFELGHEAACDAANTSPEAKGMGIWSDFDLIYSKSFVIFKLFGT